VNLTRNEVALSVKTVFHSQNVQRRQNDAYLLTAITTNNQFASSCSSSLVDSNAQNGEKRNHSDSLGLLGKETEGPTLVGANHHHITNRPH